VFELVGMTPEIHRAAERLILDRGATINLGAADALHLAAAEHHQATVLMTFDRAQAAAARATGRIEVRDSV
jgi:predicted nucleic acid-binding protein